MSIQIPSGLVSSIIEGAAGAGASLALPSILSNIEGLFAPHVAAAAAVPNAPPAPNTTDKTMSVPWASANPSLVPLYMAQGYKIVP